MLNNPRNIRFVVKTAALSTLLPAKFAKEILREVLMLFLIELQLTQLEVVIMNNKHWVTIKLRCILSIKIYLRKN